MNTAKPAPTKVIKEITRGVFQEKLLPALRPYWKNIIERRRRIQPI
jgi:hypothetical protein